MDAASYLQKSFQHIGLLRRFNECLAAGQWFNECRHMNVLTSKNCSLLLFLKSHNEDSQNGIPSVHTSPVH